MIIESGNALPLSKGEPKQYESYIRAEHECSLPLASTGSAKALHVGYAQTSESLDTDSETWQNYALGQATFPSGDSALPTKYEYRRAIRPHLRFNILRIRAGYVGLPGKIFSLFTTLRAAAPGWQAWM